MLTKCVEVATNAEGVRVLRIRDPFGQLLAERVAEGDPADRAWLADQDAEPGDLTECAAAGCDSLTQETFCAPCYDRYFEAGA